MEADQKYEQAIHTNGGMYMPHKYTKALCVRRPICACIRPDTVVWVDNAHIVGGTYSLIK